MNMYHVVIEQAEEGWRADRSLEDDSVHTQGKTLNEMTANIREVAEMLLGDDDVQVE